MKRINIAVIASTIIGVIVLVSSVSYIKRNTKYFVVPINNTELTNDEGEYKHIGAEIIISKIEKIMNKNDITISPKEIQDKKISTELLRNESDFLYETKYSRNFQPLPRTITYINMRAESLGAYSAYTLNYAGIDCLGVGFNQRFTDESPVSKEECINAVHKINESLAIHQQEAVNEVNKLRSDLNKTSYKYVIDKMRDRGVSVHWVHNRYSDDCNPQGDYKNISKKYSGVVFYDVDECISYVDKIRKKMDAQQLLYDKKVSFARVVYFIGFIFFIPLIIFLFILLVRLISNLWLKFLKNSAIAINSSERKIKIDADVKIKNDDK